MSTEPTFLTPEEIQQLTLYKKPAHQCEELDRIGIRFILTRRGTPLVLRKALDEYFSLKSANSEPEINMEALEEIG